MFCFIEGDEYSVYYEYDKNGNLVKDLNKNISSIQYNCLNLPSQIDIASTGHLMFLYGASGSKQKTIHVVRQPNGSYHTTTVDYSGNFLYENNVLKKILIDGGYVTFSGTTPVYHFYLQDHQGNNRVVVNRNGTVEQVNHYYPYGALFGVSTGGEVQPFKFSGKELERFNGLDWYDYGARFLDPVLGRWMQVDPLCEKYYDVSPYAYCANNPINYVDPNGSYITYTNDYGNTYLYYNHNFYNYGIKPTNGYAYVIGKAINVNMDDNMRRTLNVLCKMEDSSNESIKEVFMTLTDLTSKSKHNIQWLKDTDDGSYVNPIGGRNSIIHLNIDIDRKSSEFRKIGITDYEAIGHELKHSYDIQFYKNNRGKIIEESDAVRFENQIREEEKKPIRRNYSDITVINPLAKPQLWKK